MLYAELRLLVVGLLFYTADLPAMRKKPVLLAYPFGRRTLPSASQSPFLVFPARIQVSLAFPSLLAEAYDFLDVHAQF